MVITTIRVVKVKHISVNMLDQFVEKKVNKLSVFLSNHHCRKCGGLNVGNADSASTRHRVAVGLNHIPELNLPTTCDTFCNFTIPSPARDSGVRLETIREANSLMNETIAILAPVEVDNNVVAGVGVRESHGWFPVDVPNIGQNGAFRATLVPLTQLSSEDLSPAFMLYLADPSFLQHVVADVTKHFKLLETGEISVFGSLTNDLENVSFEHCGSFELKSL